MTWREQALCQRKNLELWYPPMDSTSPNDYYALGKLACHRCPVWKECLQSASSETWGLWGGLTPQERKGTVRPVHGTVELFRLGCECTPCYEANDRVATTINLNLLPGFHETFDPKSLLYALIDP